MSRIIPITFGSVRAELERLGITIRDKDEEGQYRVNFKGGTERTACYADDLLEALQMGQAMANRQAYIPVEPIPAAVQVYMSVILTAHQPVAPELDA